MADGYLNTAARSLPAIFSGETVKMTTLKDLASCTGSLKLVLTRV
jgi:hypothetical protein